MLGGNSPSSGSASAWMAKGAGWIMCSSNGSGAALSMKRFTCGNTERWWSLSRDCNAGLNATTLGVHIRPWTIARLRRCMRKMAGQQTNRPSQKPHENTPLSRPILVLPLRVANAFPLRSKAFTPLRSRTKIGALCIKSLLL